MTCTCVVALHRMAGAWVVLSDVLDEQIMLMVRSRTWLIGSGHGRNGGVERNKHNNSTEAKPYIHRPI